MVKSENYGLEVSVVAVGTLYNSMHVLYEGKQFIRIIVVIYFKKTVIARVNINYWSEMIRQAQFVQLL